MELAGGPSREGVGPGYSYPVLLLNPSCETGRLTKPLI